MYVFPLHFGYNLVSMDVLYDKLDIKEGFIHNLPIVVKLKGKEQEFFAVVLNPTDEYILISPILAHDGRQMDVRESERIEVATKMYGVLWSGFCSIVEVLKSDFEGIWLTYPDSLQKVQRRNFLRVNMTFPLEVDIYEDGLPVSTYKGYCQDLSGAGIGLKLNHSLYLYENQTAKVSFTYKSLSMNTTIKPVYQIKQDDFYKIGCQFKDVDETFIDKVHKFVVQEQIQMKKGGFL